MLIKQPTKTPTKFNVIAKVFSGVLSQINEKSAEKLLGPVFKSTKKSWEQAVSSEHSMFSGKQISLGSLKTMGIPRIIEPDIPKIKQINMIIFFSEGDAFFMKIWKKESFSGGNNGSFEEDIVNDIYEYYSGFL